MGERDEIELVGNPAPAGSLAADMQREFEVQRGRLAPPEWTMSWPRPPRDPLNEAACEVAEVRRCAEMLAGRLTRVGNAATDDDIRLGARLHAQRAGLALVIWASRPPDDDLA